MACLFVPSGAGTAPIISLREFAAIELWFDSGDIIVIGMDSAELPYSPEEFARIFALVGEKGLRKCARAGETGTLRSNLHRPP